MEQININDFEGVFEIMDQSFPQDERRKKEEQRALFSVPEYKVFVRREGGKIIAFIAVWEFERFLYVEHFAVSPKKRGGGIGADVLNELMKSYDVPVCLEVEPPVTETAVRRITFYERNGMFFNDYDYVQPPLSQGQNSLPLKIMSSGKRISKEQFEDIKSTLYKKVYKVK